MDYEMKRHPPIEGLKSRATPGSGLEPRAEDQRAEPGDICGIQRCGSGAAGGEGAGCSESKVTE